MEKSEANRRVPIGCRLGGTVIPFGGVDIADSRDDFKCNWFVSVWHQVQEMRFKTLSRVGCNAVLGKKNMAVREAACTIVKIVLRGSMVSEVANPSSGDTGGGICPICKSNDVPKFRAKDDYQFRKCRQCAFVFLHPMPKESVLESMYNAGGRITVDSYPKAKSGLHRALRTAIQLYRFAWCGPVLDIGCGGGFQVEAFRLLGMRPCGLEIGANSIAYVRNNFGMSTCYRGSSK